MKKPNSPSPLFAIFRQYSPFFAIGPPPGCAEEAFLIFILWIVEEAVCPFELEPSVTAALRRSKFNLSSIYSLQFAVIRTIIIAFFSLIFKINFNIYFSGPAVFHAPPPPPTAAYDEDDQENMPVFLAPSPPDGPVFIPPSPPICPPSTDGSDEEYELSSCAGLQIF